MKKETKADEITQLRGGEIRQDKTRTEECKGEIYQKNKKTAGKFDSFAML